MAGGPAATSINLKLESFRGSSPFVVENVALSILPSEKLISPPNEKEVRLASLFLSAKSDPGVV